MISSENDADFTQKIKNGDQICGGMNANFGPNDLAILFPRRADKSTFHPDISVSDALSKIKVAGRSGAEIFFDAIENGVRKFPLETTEKANFSRYFQNQLEKISLDEGYEIKKEDWKVVGLRFVPCAPGSSLLSQPPHPPECEPMIRLVAQPVVPTSTSSKKIADIAVHIVLSAYRRDITPEENNVQNKKFMFNTAAMCKTLFAPQSSFMSVKLESGDTTQTTSVHPGLLRETKNGGRSIGEKVKALIHEAIVPENNIVFSRLALNSITDGSDANSYKFHFMVGDINQEGKLAPRPLPFFGNVDAKTPRFSMTFLVDGQNGYKVSQELVGIPPDAAEARNAALKPVFENFWNPHFVSLTPFFNGKNEFTNPHPENGKQNLSLKETVDLVENPKAVSVAFTDCLSCHSGSTLVTERPSDLDAMVFPAEVSNVRNFGYGRNIKNQSSSNFYAEQPTISRRTHNEIKAVMQQVNGF